jgi:hypothetical protein
MIVGDEDGAHLDRVDAGIDELAPNAIATIDHVGPIVDYHHGCRIGAPSADWWSAFGAQQNQSGIVRRRQDEISFAIDRA